MAEMVLRQRKRRKDRWLHPAKRHFTVQTAWKALRVAVEAAPGFLLVFAEVLGIPSGLHVAYIAALAAADRDFKRPLAGSVLALVMRLVWGLPIGWDLAVTLALTPLAPMVVYGRNTAVLMGFTAALMLPTVVAGFLASTASMLMLSWAAVPLAALSAPVMYRAIKALQGTRHIEAMEERVAVGYLAAALLCGGARMLLGVNVGVTMAAVLVLMAGLYLGVGAGCVTGLMAGVVLSLQGLPLSLAVALSLGGFLAGMAQSIGRRWLTCAAFAMGAMLTLIISASTGYGCAPAVLLSALAIAVLPRTVIERGQLFFRRFLNNQPAPGDAYAACSLAAWEKTVDAMALAVPSPMDAETFRTPEWWQEKLCEGCPELTSCGCMLSELGVRKAETVWACRHSADEVWQGALEELRGLGCQRLYHLRQSMVYLRMEDAAAQTVIRRACDQRDMLVTHLTAMAGAARRFAMLSSGENWWDDMSARRIRRALAETAAPVRLSYVRRVQGHVQAAFELTYITGARKQAEELCRVTASVLDVPMRVARIDEDRIQLAECPLLAIEAGIASAPTSTLQAENAPCGDTAWTGLLQDGRYLAALSDGMGHGERAALASRQTVELLRLCLDAGYTRPQTLTAVNGMMLLAGQGERFSTVDLLTIDLWSGQASLDKLGAAGSWLVQGTSLTRLTGNALPLGILENIESRADHLHLAEDDVLLLLTDGLEEAFPSKAAVEAAIWACLEEDTPAAAASALLAAAAEADEGQRRDDQTAVVLVVRKAAGQAVPNAVQ